MIRALRQNMARSMAVSVATTVLDLGLFAISVALIGGAGTMLVFARGLCAVAGALSNFALNRRVAFRGVEGALSVRRQLIRYAIVALSAIALATLIWWILYGLTGIDPRVLHPISAAIVWLLFTYPMLRAWVFTRRQGA